MSVLGELIVQIKGDNSSLNQALGQAQSSTSSVVNDMVQKIGGIAIAWGAVSAAAQGINYNAMKEQAEIAFGVFLGSASQAKDMIQQLQQVALNTPLQFADVRDAGKQLLAYGISAKELVPTIKTLTDVSAGLNVPIKDLAYLYGTVKTQGRAMTIDINQFANRGLPIWESLAQVTGKSGTELRAFVEAGKVGFPIIQQAFQQMTSEGGKFFGMAEKQMDSFTGAESNLVDITSVFLSKMTEGMMAPLKTGMIDVTNAMTNSTKSAEAFGGAIGGVFSMAGTVVSPVVSFLGIIPGQLTAIGVAAGVAFAAFGPWGAAIAAALASVGALKSLIDDVGKANLQDTKDKFQGIAEQSGVTAKNTDRFIKSASAVEYSLARWTGDSAQAAAYFQNIGQHAGLTAAQVANIALNSDRTSQSTKLAAEQFLKQNNLTAIGLDNSEKLAARQAKQVEDGKALDAVYGKMYPAQLAAAQAQAEADKAAGIAAQARAEIVKANLADQTTLSQKVTAINQLSESGAEDEKSALEDKIKLRSDYIKKLQEEYQTGKATLEFVVSETQRIDALNADNSAELAKINAIEEVAKAAKAQATERADWSKKLFDQETANINAEKTEALNLAKARGDSAKDVYDINKSYDDKLMANFVQNANNERQAALDKARALKDAAGDTLQAQIAYAQSYADINAYYDNQITNYRIQKESEQKANLASTLSSQKSAWDKYWENLKTQNSDASALLVTAVQGWQDAAGSAFQAIGSGLAGNGNAWKDYQKMAVGAIASVLGALGKQLLAMAAVDAFIPGMQGAAAAEAAAGAAALIASGAMSSFASSVDSASSSSSSATQSVIGLSEALSTFASQAGYALSRSRTLPSYDALRNDLAQIRVQAGETEAGFKALWKGALAPSYIGLAYEAMLSSIQQQTASFWSSLSSVGMDIGKTLVDDITKGVNSSDFLNDIKDYIRKAVIQAAVYTDSMNNTLAQIGAEIAHGITSGFTTDSLGSIKDELSQVFSTATTAANQATAVINAVFDDSAATIQAQAKANADAAAAASAKALQDQYAATGQKIGDAFTQALQDGTSNADFTKSIGDMLRKITIEAAVLAAGYSDKFKAIGQQLAEGIQNGLDSTTLESIKNQISGMYTEAQKTVKTINSVFDQVTGFASTATPTVPAYASGTDYAPGGLSIVGEQGPELINVPRGSQIVPSGQTSNIIRGNFGQDSRDSRNGDVNISVQSNAPLDPLQTANQIKMTMESLAFKGVI